MPSSDGVGGVEGEAVREARGGDGVPEVVGLGVAARDGGGVRPEDAVGGVGAGGVLAVEAARVGGGVLAGTRVGDGAVRRRDGAGGGGLRRAEGGEGEEREGRKRTRINHCASRVQGGPSAQRQQSPRWSALAPLPCGASRKDEPSGPATHQNEARMVDFLPSTSGSHRATPSTHPDLPAHRKTAENPHEFDFHGIHKRKPSGNAPSRFKTHEKAGEGAGLRDRKMGEIHRKRGRLGDERWRRVHHPPGTYRRSRAKSTTRRA